MKKLFFFGALLPMLCLGACGGGAKSAAVADADTLVEKDTTPPKGEPSIYTLGAPCVGTHQKLALQPANTRFDEVL